MERKEENISNHNEEQSFLFSLLQKMTQIIEYRTVISNIADKLTDTSDEMFKMMERLNKKTQNIPSYTINILKNLHTIADKSAVERGIENYQKFNKCKIK